MSVVLDETARAELRRAALRVLGVEQLLLIVHAVSFPFAGRTDLGRGSPWSAESLALAARVAELGFTGLQLGPMGRTTASNPSPYDSTLFSRDDLAVEVGQLVEAGLLEDAEVEAATAPAADTAAQGARNLADHGRARRAGAALLDRAADRFFSAGGDADGDYRAFLARSADWLEADALHEALAGQYGGAAWEEWPLAVDRELFTAEGPLVRARRGLLATLHASRLQRYRFAQFEVSRQLAGWRRAMHGLGLTVWGDLQVGISYADRWRLSRLFLPGYLMGAPPSRTNPAGQPWGYPVLDPGQQGEDGAARRLWRARIAAVLGDFDGVRVDHPHGLVCPWVYRAGTAVPEEAVRAGARLHESPALADHAELARFARVAPAQLRGDVVRYSEDLVSDLSADQVQAYATLLQDLVDEVGARGDRPVQRLACEVLSTRPTPLRRVAEHLGLGRFRVTAKADPDDPRDVYASNSAAPEDWVMVGNHDTAPIWQLADEWQRSDRAAREARHLAAALGDAEPDAGLAADGAALVHAKVADLFASPARHVMLFFPDLFGQRELYNRPGEVHPDNWRLRVPSDWRARLADPGGHGALDLDRVLALALRMRAKGAAGDLLDLAERLYPAR